MIIMQINQSPDGFHDLQSQSHRRTVWLPDYIEVPAHLEQAAWDSGGFCDLAIEDGVLVGITPTERPEPAAEAMTTEEAAMDMLADIDYRLGFMELGAQRKETM